MSGILKRERSCEDGIDLKMAAGMVDWDNIEGSLKELESAKG